MSEMLIDDVTVPDFGYNDEPRKLAFVCSKGSLDMINKATMGHLHFSPVGNPATHMPAALAPLPGMQALATMKMKKSLEDLNVPDVPSFLEHLSDMGAHLWACKMSVDMFDLEDDDMTPLLEGVLNVGEFIELIDGAQTMLV
jgi:peroxiredoxin family protein